MEMTRIQRAVLDLVVEVAGEKGSRGVFPGDVLRPEINVAVGEALGQLVEMGVLTHRLLGVNRTDAYTTKNPRL